MADTYSPDLLTAKILEMKLAAIDGLMRWRGFTGSLTEGWTWHSDFSRIEPPDANAEGGGREVNDYGDGNVYPVEQQEGALTFEDSFRAIRSLVDDTLEPWLDLPDWAALGSAAEALLVCCQKITLTEARDDQTTGIGPLSGNLNSAVDTMSQMGGVTIGTFRSEFLSLLVGAVGGMHEMSLVLGGVLAAEEKMWRTASENLMATVQSAIDAFNALESGGGIGWKSFVGVAGIAVTGVSIFVTGGAGATLLSGAGTVLDLLDSAIPEKKEDEDDGDPTTVSGDSPRAITDGLTAGIKAINDALVEEEQKLDDNLGVNLDRIRASRDSRGALDLRTPRMLEKHTSTGILAGRDGEIDMDIDLVADVADLYLDEVQRQLSMAAAKSQESDGPISMWSRDSALGLAYSGPYFRWVEMSRLLSELLLDLSWETKHSAKLLSIAARDIYDQDFDAGAAFAKEERRIERGSPADPFAPPPPTTIRPGLGNKEIPLV